MDFIKEDLPIPLDPHKSALLAEKPSENNKELRALDIETLQSELGIEGKEQNGQFKVTVPQNDLNVTVDGFKIIPYFIVK